MRASVGAPAPGPIAAHVIGVRRVLRSVLDRPLTSFHLVVGLMVALCALGLVMVLSASQIDSYRRTGDPYSVFYHQVVYCGLGSGLFLVMLRVPVRRWRAASPWLVMVSLVALAAVLVPGLGLTVAGAQKWFSIAGVTLEPSEPAKLALVLWGAHVLTARRGRLHEWQHALSPVVPVALLMAATIILEPDLGSAVCVILILFALLFFAGVAGRLLGILVAGAGGAVLLLALTASYRMARITAYLDPGASDPLGPGYQTRQALYSLADGHLLGTGIGQGAAQWSYLPNAANDFIFAIIGEQLGMIGATAVLALYGLLAYTGMRIAGRTLDPWRRVVVATVTSWVVLQAVINVGYVLGLLPVTGITLPLISSGGSSVVITMGAFGLLAAAAREEPEARAALSAGGRRAAPARGYRPFRNGAQVRR